VIIDDPLDDNAKTMDYADLAAGRYDVGINDFHTYLAQ
jgi:hypothetical protein